MKIIRWQVENEKRWDAKRKSHKVLYFKFVMFLTCGLCDLIFGYKSYPDEFMQLSIILLGLICLKESIVKGIAIYEILKAEGMSKL